MNSRPTGSVNGILSSSGFIQSKQRDYLAEPPLCQKARKTEVLQTPHFGVLKHPVSS